MLTFLLTSHGSIMSMSEGEVAAIERAKERVAKMLSSPEQLDKLDSYLVTAKIKKEAAELKYKSSAQNRMEDVNSAVKKLMTAMTDMNDIKVGLSKVEASLARIPELSENLYECREEYVRYSQYATAYKNYNFIFTVHEEVKKTIMMIEEGNLLTAHKVIVMRQVRDNILDILNGHTISLGDIWVLMFQEKMGIGKSPGQILRFPLEVNLPQLTSDSIYIAEFSLLINQRDTSLKILAVKEHRQKDIGFISPGRPKMFREKALAILKESTLRRIEGTITEDREEDKTWLIKHLEILRLHILEDMRVIHSLCVPCFPPEYDIVNWYVKVYHSFLSKHILCIVEGGLEDNEYVTLLSWVLNTYPSEELMGHPSLDVDVKSLEVLLTTDVLNQQINSYVETIHDKYTVYMSRALDLEKQEWYSNKPPKDSSENYSTTDLPILLRDMVVQNLDVAALISQDVQVMALVCSLKQLRNFATQIQEAVDEYKTTYFASIQRQISGGLLSGNLFGGNLFKNPFEDVDENEEEKEKNIEYFTEYIVALANSSQALTDVMVSFKNKFWANKTEPKIAQEFGEAIQTYQQVRDNILDILVEELRIELQPQFDRLLTQDWLSSDKQPVQVICETLQDYFQKYKHLYKKSFDHVTGSSLTMISIQYITAILQKRLSIKTKEDRNQVAEIIEMDSNNIGGVFESVSPDLVKFDSPLEIINGMAEVLKQNDLDFLGLVLHRLLHRYPDLSAEQLSSLLMFRGDLGWLDTRQRVANIMEDYQKQVNKRKSGPIPTSILSQVHLY
ncbi:unnamed protein product, partial [Meganyctiphanes norvegica]